jgi:hypothetical protein
MKKITLLLAAVMFIAGFARAQTASWINYKIDEKLSCKMPEQPTQVEEHSVYAKGKDTTVYVVAVVDFAKLATGIDSAQLATMAPTPEFANQFKNGMLGQMPGSTMGDVTIGKWKGHTSYAMDGANAANKQKLYAFMVLIGTKMYSLMVVTPDTHNADAKNNFFATLTTN